MTRRQMLLTSARSFVLIALAASFVGHRSALATGPDQEQADLANALSGVKVSLQQGFTASEQEGQPISGKFEMDEGKLQLSIYTTKEGKFFEVIVDHMTGNITKVEPITEGEDLTHAKSQNAAMDRAKAKLADAATRAKGQAKGEAGDVVVVSAMPELKDDRPEATIVLLQGKRFSTASERLN
ncbi:PepSY domain-containing protein [Bradyrhizobium tropiciagri]|uniref:PepSY domain-containing protein n=1 Tax=Bradyrhizobium tropiciagri TaxID=312253 RepID=UPI000B2D61F2|nr:PepSY domain-containing protein [Bradyrhizobium tropiciagri]